jgi:type VI secretion system secreted protein Hcp
MAYEAYMVVDGKKQGVIKGSVEREEHKDKIGVIAVDHDIESPRDVHTGQASGKRVHGSFRITKEVDKATPLLYQALCSNEQLKKVEIKFYRTSPDGTEENLFTTTLENATMNHIKDIMHLTKDKTKMDLPWMEEISFTYEKITWRHELAKTEFTDSWLKG